MRTLVCSILFLMGALVSSEAAADNPASWVIDQTLTRDDAALFWTSPTAVDLGFDVYEFRYEITRVRVTAGILTLDLTDQLAAEFDLIGAGYSGALPATLIDLPLSDTTSGTTADVLIEVDSLGLGQAAFTNIQLGTVDVFGLPVNINAVRVEASVEVEGFIQATGDYNLDTVVDALDYDGWAAAYGLANQVLADGNGDGAVDAADYTVWRDSLSVSATGVPEPAGWVLLSAAGALATPLSSRGRRAPWRGRRVRCRS